MGKRSVMLAIAVAVGLSAGSALAQGSGIVEYVEEGYEETPIEAAAAAGCPPAGVTPLPYRLANEPRLYQVICTQNFDAFSVAGSTTRTERFAIVQCVQWGCHVSSIIARPGIRTR